MYGGYFSSEVDCGWSFVGLEDVIVMKSGAFFVDLTGTTVMEECREYLGDSADARRSCSANKTSSVSCGTLQPIRLLNCS